MKAVVLARGEGRRMQAGSSSELSPEQQRAAGSGAKGMMPIGDAAARPFLDYVLSGLADAGCSDVCLVIGPHHSTIRESYGDPSRLRRLRIAFAVQREATGTAPAVLAAAPFAAADPFLVLNADNLYPTEVLRSLVALDGPGLPAFAADALVAASGFPPDRVGSFAVVTADADGFLEAIAEKPGADAVTKPGVQVSMNLWRFDARIFPACAAVPRSTRGEYELPEAVGLAVASGVRFKLMRAEGAVLDLSTRSDVAGVTRRLAGLEPRL